MIHYVEISEINEILQELKAQKIDPRHIKLCCDQLCTKNIKLVVKHYLLNCCDPVNTIMKLSNVNLDEQPTEEYVVMKFPDVII